VNPVDPVEKTSVFSSRQWLFVLARVYLGVSFFFSDHGNAQPNELTGFLKFAARNGYSWYQHFLDSFVVPHSATFGTLVVVAEIYVGIALVIGFTTRLATCVALFLLLNYMCAKGLCRGARASINRISSWQLSSFSAMRAAYLASINCWPNDFQRSGFCEAFGIALI
jgi:uncharacterized membrane protein YphA (DoxX/SURF4 family)